MAEDPLTDTKYPLLKSSLTAVTLLSTLVTVGLSIGTYFLKQGVDETEGRLKDRAQKLEESRERIARYSYVYNLLSTVEKGSPSQRTLAVNTARLALDSHEQETLFNGLLYSQSEALADAGRQGVAAIARASGNAPDDPLRRLRERSESPSPSAPDAPQPAPPEVEASPEPVALSPVAPPPVEPPEPVVSEARVVLHTTKDDKDKGTRVSVSILVGSAEVFRWDDDAKHEWERGSYERLVLKPPITELPISRFQDAKIKICLIRDRAHGWQFDYTGQLFIGAKAERSFKREKNIIANGRGESCVEGPLH